MSTITKSKVGNLTLNQDIVSNVKISDSDILSRDSDAIPSDNAIINYIANQDYTAFEVHPTYNSIYAGTTSDVKTIISEYEYGTEYSIGQFVLKSNEIYTAKQEMLSSDNIVPGQSTNWQDYWDVGNIHELDGLYLTYEEDVPANHILYLQFYCYSKDKKDNDIVIDWGDGQQTIISESNISYDNYETENSDVYKYSGFTISHSYSEEGKFIVKVFGKDYFMLRCNPAGKADDCIVSRVFDRDLPVASCLRNVSSFAKESKRLLKINVPYGYDFKNITNWTQAFYGCKNLKKLSISFGSMQKSFHAIQSLFGNCPYLESDISSVLLFCKNIPELKNYRGILANCKKVYGTVDGTYLWENLDAVNLPDTNKLMFYGCSKEIRNQVPLSWGGLNQEIENNIIQRTRTAIDYATAKIQKIEDVIGKSTVVSVDLTEKSLPGYADYGTGVIADELCDIYENAVIDNIYPGQNYYIKCDLRNGLGICVYDHEYLLKSWNTDDRVVVNSNNYNTSADAYAVISDSMSEQDFINALLTGSVDDNIHYLRKAFPYSEYLESTNPNTNGMYEIQIPDGATSLKVSNRPQNTALKIAKTDIQYTKDSERIDDIMSNISEEVFEDYNVEISSNCYINHDGSIAAYDRWPAGVTRQIQFDSNDKFKYTATVRNNAMSYIIYDVHGQKLAVFNRSRNPSYAIDRYVDEVVDCSTLLQQFPTAKTIAFGALMASNIDLDLSIKKLQRKYNIDSHVKTYAADETTLTLDGNVFSVKSNVFQNKGDYLSANALANYKTYDDTVNDLSDSGYATKKDIQDAGHANDSTITLQWNGNTTSSFTLNQPDNKTIDLGDVGGVSYNYVSSQLSVDGYLTKVSADNDYQPKGNYLDKSDLDDVNAIMFGQSNIKEFESEELIANTYLNPSGGTTQIANSYFVTPLLEVVPKNILEISGYQIKKNQTRLYAFYGATSAYIPNTIYTAESSDVDVSTATAIVPDEAKYIRIGTFGNNPVCVKSYSSITDLDAKQNRSFILSSLQLSIENHASIIENLTKNIPSQKVVVPAEDFILSTRINANGTVVVDSVGYKTSPLIAVEPTNVIKIAGIGDATRRLYAFYDATSAYIPNTTYPNATDLVLATNVTSAMVVAPNDAAFIKIATSKTGTIISCEIFKSLNDKIKLACQDEYSSAISHLSSYSYIPGTNDDIVEPVDYIVPDNYIVAANGTGYGPNSIYKCTNFMPIQNGDVFYYTGTVRSNGCGYAIYDENKLFLSSYLTGNAEVNYENYEIDATTLLNEYEQLGTGKTPAYIRFSDIPRSGSTAKPLKVLRNNVQIPASYAINKIENEIYDLSARNDSKNVLYGKKYLTFGDSYTAANFTYWKDPVTGEYGRNSDTAYDSSKGIWKSYGWHIANRNAMSYTNKAESGGTLTYATTQTAGSLAKDLTTESTFADLSGLIKDADYITIAYGLNDLKDYDGHHNLCPVGEKTDSTINTMWGAWNTVLSTIFLLNPDVKLGIIMTDGGFSEDQRNRQLSVANYWGIPYLDLKGDPQVPLMITINGGNTIYGRGEISQFIIEEKRKQFCLRIKNEDLVPTDPHLSAIDYHPNPYAHAYRSTIIEDFLRRL